MKRVLFVSLTAFLLFRAAFAGQIYGILRDGEQSVAEGVVIEMIYSDKSGEKRYAAKTDKYGSYKVYAPISGRFWLRVYYAGDWSQPYQVSSYDDPVRYDFDLVRQSDGKYVLKRR